LSKIIGGGVDQFLVCDEAEGSASHRSLLALPRLVLAALDKIIHYDSPRSENETWVMCSQECLADGQLGVRLADGGFLGGSQAFCLIAVLRAKALAAPRECILEVEYSATAEEPESIFRLHLYSFYEVLGNRLMGNGRAHLG